MGFRLGFDCGFRYPVVLVVLDGYGRDWSNTNTFILQYLNWHGQAPTVDLSVGSLPKVSTFLGDASGLLAFTIRLIAGLSCAGGKPAWFTLSKEGDCLHEVIAFRTKNPDAINAEFAMSSWKTSAHRFA